MHEMSIATSIMDIAKEYAQKENAIKIKEIELSIGTLSGIELESLNFAMEVCQKQANMQAKIKIDRIQAMGKCMHCEKEYEVEQIFDACPHCQNHGTQLLCGKEMQVKSIVIE